jgi:hypothetical protein
MAELYKRPVSSFNLRRVGFSCGPQSFIVSSHAMLLYENPQLGRKGWQKGLVCSFRQSNNTAIKINLRRLFALHALINNSGIV